MALVKVVHLHLSQIYGPRFWTEVTNFRATWGWIRNVQVVSAIIIFYVKRAHILSKVELVVLFHLLVLLE